MYALSYCCYPAVRSLNVSTLDVYSYTQAWYTVLDESQTVVEVQGCKDAHILLSTGVNVWQDGYEVALGIKSNTESVIRENVYGANVVTRETPGIMSCDEYRLVSSCVLS